MRRVTSIVTGTLLLAALGGLQRLVPDADRIYEPIASTGSLRQDVATQPYTLRVDDVEIGRRLVITNTSSTPTRDTRGLWVVLRITATATKQRVGLGKPVLRAQDGTEYGATDRFFGFANSNLEAGIPNSGPLAFELPPAAVPGAVLVITAPAYRGGIQRLSGALGPAVHIDLGITAAQAAAPAPTVNVEQVY
ncbi:hypothetical protein [Nonomuraea sp. B19D2]|uniref:hypothetical protein n=1 Tax=Nonomuraea sp. B19D2 TaxID=3159561 RepID=UPI0032D9EE9F